MAARRWSSWAGGGPAAPRAVETLREEGFDGPIVLAGEEAVRPYERPPLSKGFLQGSTPADEAFVHSEDWYDASGVELRTATRVVALNVSDREVEFDDETKLRYDRVLLATGSRARPLTVPGGHLPGVHTLRTLADAQELRAALRAASRVVVAGSGWIGTEVAASARRIGREVTIVGRDTVPLERVLGREVGAVYGGLHRDNGVHLVMETEVESVRGSGRVEEVRTADGRTFPCDVLVAGVGAAPRLELAESAGLAVNGGITTDDRLHTSGNWVYAAGDVAAAWHPVFQSRLRVEHWANAGNQGGVAARNMLGGNVPYDRIPYFYSDQFDLGTEYSGYAPRWDRVVFRGDAARREFIAFWLHEGRVVAGMNANVWDVVEPIQELVRSGRVVDPGRLADPAVPLADTDRVGGMTGNS